MNKSSIIVLTGATGFLGNHLLAALLAKGYEVVAVKRSFSDTSKIKEVLDHEKLHFFDIDLEDPRKLFEKYSVDTIIHTATEYGRGDAPVFRILEANLILPLRLAELGIENGARCFINTDSYFNKSSSTYSNLLNYSLSKKSLLIWLRQLSSRIKVINIMLEHIYGPGDSRSKFVEDLIQQIALDRVDRVHLTHGHQKRDFVYIDDVVQAFITLTEYGSTHEFTFKNFEVGTGKSVQLRDFVQMVKHLTRSATVLGFGDIEYRSDEIMDSKADISALTELGWQDAIRRMTFQGLANMSSMPSSTLWVLATRHRRWRWAIRFLKSRCALMSWCWIICICTQLAATYF